MAADYALVFTCEHTGTDTDPPRARLNDTLISLTNAHGIERVECFLPHPDYASVPVFKDGPPPAAILEFRASSIDALKAFGESKALQSVIRNAPGDDWRAGFFHIVREPVAGAMHADEREAPVSFVVRYFPPVDDPVHFSEHYVKHHPPILARFPKIRNVLCYLPQEAALDGFLPDNTVIRNEVVFDSIADLIGALGSPVLSELRADSATFASFGYSTHHAMLRSLVANVR